MNSQSQQSVRELLDEKPKQVFMDKAAAHVHEFYLNGEILGSDTYTEWFDKIRHAPESDAIKIYINSRGGDLATTVQFMRVMNESNATIIASVEGDCMSAATLIFLTAKAHEISNHSLFMFHNYSSLVYGKGNEMTAEVLHTKKWGEKLMRDVYRDFLSKPEIDALLSGSDIWLAPEEVVERLTKRNLKRSKSKR